jgi:phosphoribulokinase
MDDYINFITPQFSRTHINFQRVPTVDTSNPFSAKVIPSLDESMLVIRFQHQAGGLPLPAVDDRRRLHVQDEHHRRAGCVMGFAMELILRP